jgi:hypothetical protein
MHTRRHTVAVRLLRWVLVLPVTVLSGFLAMVVGQLVNAAYQKFLGFGEKFMLYALTFIGSVAMSWVGIALGCKTAPSHRRLVFYFLAALFVLFNIPATMELLTHFNGVLLAALIGTVVGIVGAWNASSAKEVAAPQQNVGGVLPLVIDHPVNQHAARLLRTVDEPVSSTTQPFLQLMNWWSERHASAFDGKYRAALEGTLDTMLYATDQRAMLKFFTVSESGDTYDFDEFIEKEDAEVAAEWLWQALHEKLGATLPNYHVMPP